MSTTVETYLKIDDKFILVDDYDGALPDEFYVEGAIRLEIAGQVILCEKHWDLVDQLWCYIVEGLGHLALGEVCDIGFPDQPLRFIVEPISDYCVEVIIGDESYRVDRQSFFGAMLEGAEKFFVAMKRLSPDASDTWERYLSEVKSLVR